VRLPGHCSGEQLDAVGVAEALLMNRSLGSLLAAQVVLGQRRPLVGRGGLIAHQHHAALESLTAQSLGRLGSREACSPLSRTLTSRTTLAPLLVMRQLGRAGPPSCPRSSQYQ